MHKVGPSFSLHSSEGLGDELKGDGVDPAGQHQNTEGFRVKGLQFRAFYHHPGPL